MSATTVSVNRSPVAEGGALNLSISNRSSPSTSSILDSLAVQQHSNLQHLQSHHPSTSLQPAAVASSSHVNQRDSWPPDTYRGAYRDPQELKARRDSVVSVIGILRSPKETEVILSLVGIWPIAIRQVCNIDHKGDKPYLYDIDC